jgi:predicted ATP-grasp superfamily ATP-dependent carboligase
LRGPISIVAKVNVLLLSGWVDQAFTFVRSFSRQKDLNMYVADCWPNSPCGYSKYCKRFHLVPKPEDPEHIPAILAVCRQEGIDIILPVQHDEVIEVAQAKELFEKAGIRVPVPGYPLIELAIDKYQMAKLASENGIATPATYLLSEIEGSARPFQDTFTTGLEGVAKAIGFPMLTKLREGTGQQGQKLVQNVGELQAQIGFLLDGYSPEEIILQEYIPGSVEDSMYTVGLVYNHRHDLRACVPLKKVRSKPYNGGTAICTRAENRRDVRNLAVRLMDCLGEWEGIADVEVKIDPRNEEPKFIELNPRPWGSIYGAYAAGVDFPMLWLEVAQRKDFDAIEGYQEGVHASFLTRDLLLLAEIAGGLFSDSRAELWPVLRTYIWPYVRWGRNAQKPVSAIHRTSDFVLGDLRPFLKNVYRVRKNLLPKRWRD